MNICFLAPANSIHVIKLCNYFVGHGHYVNVVSFTEGNIEGVKVHLVNTDVDTGGSDLGKLRYLLYSHKVRKIVDAINPDIVNVHYATSYGTVAALAGLKHYVLSVW